MLALAFFTLFAFAVFASTSDTCSGKAASPDDLLSTDCSACMHIALSMHLHVIENKETNYKKQKKILEKHGKTFYEYGKNATETRMIKTHMHYQHILEEAGDEEMLWDWIKETPDMAEFADQACRSEAFCSRVDHMKMKMKD